MNKNELILDNYKDVRIKLINRLILRPDTTTQALFNNLWYCDEAEAILSIIKNKIELSKSFFSSCAQLDFFTVSKYNERILDYSLNHVSYALLSDNEQLINAYASLRYQRGLNAELSMDEMVEIGESPIWCNTVQHFMVGNQQGVEKNLNILETLTLPKLEKSHQGLLDDYQYYRALYTRDKNKIEEILDKLVSPVIHRRRNESPVLNQYISHPALGYAKLAWRAGLQVEVNSPLVPRALLPIQPNPDYSVRYDFIKGII